MHGVHDLGAARDGSQRHTTGDTLGRRDEVWNDTLMLAREPVTRAAEAGLDLVGDEYDAILLGECCHRREVAGCGHDETALALNGFDDDGGYVRGADLLLDATDRPLGDLGTVMRAVAEGVRGGYPVDLRGKGAETVLVRHVLRGHAHREIGAAVVAVLDDDDRGTLREHASDFHGVLDRLGP